MNFWFLLIYFIFLESQAPSIMLEFINVSSNPTILMLIQFNSFLVFQDYQGLTFIRVFRGLGFEYILLRGVEQGGGNGTKLPPLN